MALQSRYRWLVTILSCVCLVRAEGGDGSASGVELPSFAYEINK